MDMWISLNGVQTAERNLEQAARKIATPSIPDTPFSKSADVFQPTDIAAELIAADQAKIAAKANLRAISTQTDLEQEILNLFA
jgi:hypothetical protein